MNEFEAGEIFDELLGPGSERRLSEGLPPLFGGWRHIPAAIGVAAFAIVIGIVNILERTFHWLHERTHETAFHEMVLAIEKELMIAGTMAFILKMILNTSNFLDLEWLYALDFADLVIPVTAFLYCFIGSILIIVSVLKMDLWSQAYNMNLVELLQQFYDSSEKYWYGRFYWFPISFATFKMEFRIMHNIFCEQYHVDRDALPFDDYVRVSWEQYLIKLVEIGPHLWMWVISWLGLNWIRCELDLNVPDLGYEYANSTSTDSKACEKDSEPGCNYSHVEESLVIYLCIGCSLLLWTSIMALFSRVYILRLFSIYGIEGIDDYPRFLKLLEEVNEEDLNNEEKKLSTSELKQAVEEVKSRENRRKLLKRPATPMLDLMKKLFPFLFEKPPDFSQLEEDADLNSVKASRKSSVKLAIPDDDSDEEERRSTKSRSPSSCGVNIAELRGSMKRFQSVIPPIDTRIKDIAENMESHKYSVDLKTIFLFKSPELYFHFIDLLMMSMSSYISFWLCNYLTAIDNLPHHQTIWKVVALLPGILSAALFSQIVESAVLLHSISQLDPDVVEDILEQREMASQLGQFVREKILRRLKSMGEGREYLEQLFRAIDTNNSDLLSRSEFKIFCVEMSISFSERRWRQIFREIDRNADNEISFDELFFFLYPDSTEAIEKEKSRLEELDEIAKKKELGSFMSEGDQYYSKELEAINRIGGTLRKGQRDRRVTMHQDKIQSYRMQAGELSEQNDKVKPSTKLFHEGWTSGGRSSVYKGNSVAATNTNSGNSTREAGSSEDKVPYGEQELVELRTASSMSHNNFHDHEEDEWDGEELDA